MVARSTRLLTALLALLRCARSAARPFVAARRTPSRPSARQATQPHLLLCSVRALPHVRRAPAPHALAPQRAPSNSVALSPRSAPVRAQRRTPSRPSARQATQSHLPRSAPVRAQRRTPSRPSARQATQPHLCLALLRCARSAARPRAPARAKQLSRMPGTKTSEKSWKTRSRSAIESGIREPARPENYCSNRSRLTPRAPAAPYASLQLLGDLRRARSAARPTAAYSRSSATPTPSASSAHCSPHS